MKTTALLCLLLAACGTVVEPVPLEPTNFTRAPHGTPLVFVPGIKGSAIADDENDLVYLTRSEVIGYDTPDLALPTRLEGDKQGTDHKWPVGILRELYLVPALVGEDIYGPWLDALKKVERPVYLFAYDWRRDNLETLDQLEKLVATVRERHGKPVELIGHSMGGMLSLALLARGNSDLAAVTMAGSPLQGGVGFLPDLHDGVSVGMNEHLLSPRVLSTFPSVFCFFPSVPGADIDVAEFDYYAPESWMNAKVGPYKTQPPRDFDALFAWSLRRAKAFRDLVELEPATTVPLTVVASDGVPTLTTVHYAGGALDFTSTPREPGDGRVPLSRATPKRLRYELVTSKAEHAALLNDPKVIDALLAR